MKLWAGHEWDVRTDGRTDGQGDDYMLPRNFSGSIIIKLQMQNLNGRWIHRTKVFKIQAFSYISETIIALGCTRIFGFEHKFNKV